LDRLFSCIDYTIGVHTGQPFICKYFKKPGKTLKNYKKVIYDYLGLFWVGVLRGRYTARYRETENGEMVYLKSLFKII
jgi:hypothetical protein